MAKNSGEDFFPAVRNPESNQVINGRCLIRTGDQHRVVTVSGIVMAHYGLEALTSLEREQRTIRGFKIAKSKLGSEIWNLDSERFMLGRQD